MCIIFLFKNIKKLLKHDDVRQQNRVHFSHLELSSQTNLITFKINAHFKETNNTNLLVMNSKNKIKINKITSNYTQRILKKTIAVTKKQYQNLNIVRAQIHVNVLFTICSLKFSQNQF